MNGRDCTNAFGKAPESFKRRVALTLSGMEEKSGARHLSLRLAILAGIILLLMAGVVYAASTEWKLMDFFSSWYCRTPSGKVQEVVQESAVNRVFQLGDFVVTLEEAVADSRYMYVSANVRRKDGEDAALLPMNISTKTNMREVVGRHPYIMHLPDESPENQENSFILDPAAYIPGADLRTIWGASREEGKRLMGVIMWVQYGDTCNDLTSFTILPDGSASFVMGSAIQAEAEKTLDVSVYLLTGEVGEHGQYVNGSVRERIPLALPVLPATQEKVVDAGDAVMAGTDVTVDRIEFYLTPLTLHYQLYYSASPEQKKALDPYFFFEFLNEQGKTAHFGLSLRTYTRALDETHYIQIGSLLWDQIPDHFAIRGIQPTGAKDFEKIPLAVP